MLPEGVTVKKYHVSAMGKLGKELTEAWAIATTLGIADDIEKRLFIAVQQHRTIDNLDAIKNLFTTVGIAPQAYEDARRSITVRTMVEQQEKMAERFSVQSTPTFYVKGTYKINNNGFKATTPDSYVTMFTQQVMLLMNEKNL
ncbi:DsbA family protein [Serratia ficaria]|nr:DsbA family protein [Serratia ficaria]CAI2092313.1 Thiol:disulfide interchange protein DsbA precursor [Serratia ficaria]